MKIKLVGKTSTGTAPRHLPPGVAQEALEASPVVFERGLSRRDLMYRLVGGRKFMGITTEGIRGYCRTQREQFQPHHIPTRKQVHIWLARSGYDWRLADEHGVGYTDDQLTEARKEAEEFLKQKAARAKRSTIPD